MKTFKFFLILVLFFSFLSLVSADENLYDYNEPFSYDSFEFYTSSDPSQWNWDNVDWTKVDFTRTELYTSDAFYANLPSTGYSFLDYTKVDYNNPHFDHSFVNPEKYIKDIGCSQCLLDIKGLDKSLSSDGLERYSLQEVRVRYSHDGIKHQNGDFVSIPGTYPSGTQFSVVKEGIFVKVPSGTILNDISQKDTIVLDTSIGGFYVKDRMHSKTKFEEITYNGRKIRGVLSFKNGDAYLSSDQEVYIDSVLITSFPRVQDSISKAKGKEISPSKGHVNIYFEDGIKVAPFVLLDQEEKIVSFASSAANSFSVSFAEGNSFVSVDNSQRLVFEPSGETRVDVELREGLIPKVTAFLSSDSKMLLVNGPSIYSLTAKPQFQLEAQTKNTAVPLTLLPLNRETGKNVYGEEGKKIIFDSSKNVVRVADFLDPRNLECLSCVKDLRSNDFLFYYTRGKLQRSGVERVDFKDEAAESNAVLSTQVLNSYLDLPDKVRESVKALEIVSPEELEKKCGEQTGGCAFPESRKIIISADTEASAIDPGLLYHEAAHTRTFILQKLEGDEDSLRTTSEASLKGYQLELMRKYNLKKSPGVVFSDGKDISLEPRPGWNPTGIYLPEDAPLDGPDEEKLLRMASAVTKIKTGFISEWKKAAGDVYGKDLGEKVVAGVNAQNWKDLSAGPRHGCIRAYGCNDYEEDIATFVEQISNDHSLYKPLIMPDSPVYDPRYRQKLDLLYKHGFITEEDYKAIVEEK